MLNFTLNIGGNGISKAVNAEVIRSASGATNNGEWVTVLIDVETLFGTKAASEAAK